VVEGTTPTGAGTTFFLKNIWNYISYSHKPPPENYTVRLNATFIVKFCKKQLTSF